jgi:YHS domain-containing protein
VAYFTEGKALFGRAEFELNLEGSVWRFNNEGNRGAFEKNPRSMRRSSAAMTRSP